MHTYLVALSFALWGVQLWAIRFVSALVGLITIPVIFWLAKELLRQEGREPSLVPILSAFFLPHLTGTSSTAGQGWKWSHCLSSRRHCSTSSGEESAPTDDGH